MFNRFGQWVFHNKWKTFCAWIVILVAVILGVAKTGSNFDDNLKINGLPSTEVQKTLKKEFKVNSEAGTMKVVIQTPKKGDVNKSNIQKDVAKAIKEIKHNKGNGLKSVTNPYSSQILSKDKTTTYVDMTFKKDARIVSQHQIKMVENAFNKHVKHVNNAKVAFTGTVQITPYDIGGASELIGIIIAFILLMILFKSFVSAGLPILSALMGLITGIVIVTIGSTFFTLASTASTLATMLSLAVGIDYALFIVHRYRDERKHHDGAEALGNALQTAGSSVLFAGLTVVIAILGLSIVGIAFLTQMAVATAVGVLFAICSALTFLPALIALCSKWVKPSKKDMAKNDEDVKAGFFSNIIMKFPLVTVIVTLAILICSAIPMTHMRLGMPYNGSLPNDNTERQAYDMISDKFGEGVNAPMIGVVKLNESQSHKTQEKNLKKITNHIKDMKGVKMIVPVTNEKAIKQLKSPQYQAQMKQQIQQQVQAKVKEMIQKDPSLAPKAQVLGKQIGAQYAQKAQAEAKAKVISPIPAHISKNHRYAYFVMIPKKGSETVQTTDLTHNIKKYSEKVQKNDKTKITLTGINAINIDTTAKLNAAIPVFAGVVIVLAFILLMFMFRSFLIPLIAMLGFGLSLVASFGITTLTIQDGFAKGLLGISKGAPVLSFLPVIFIGILFGLAMDYEVFMVSRAREEYVKTGDNNHSILVALKSSGPVIVTAALIMMAVFGSFALSTNTTIKSLGLSLAFGIFFDAFLVRLLIVPSMMKLFGKANWYFPGFKKNK